MDRVIFHCDCNGFYASVEELMRPELKTVPMAVAGDPESRHGIILAKNELAKRYGIQTAETIGICSSPDNIITVYMNRQELIGRQRQLTC